MCHAHTSWPTSSPVPAGGDLGLDFGGADGALSSTTPGGFNPLPDFEGSGHAMAASGGLNTQLRTGGGVDFDINGNVRNNQLQSIAGTLTSGLQDQIGDNLQENRVYVYQHNVSETNATTTTSIKAKIGYGWNLSPQVAASLNAENSIGLSASPAGELITNTIHDFAEIDASGGTQDMDFIGLTITLNESVSDAPVLTSNFSGTLEIANVFISRGDGELTIDASETQATTGSGWVNWRDNGVSTQTETYDTDWTRIHDTRDHEEEPVYQYQFLDEVYSNTTTSQSESTGNITLVMASDGTVTEHGTADSTYQDSVDSSYTVNLDNYITYYEPFDLQTWVRHANNGTITRTFNQSVGGGASFNSSQNPSLVVTSPTTSGDTEPQVSGQIDYTFSYSYGSGGGSSSTSSNEDLLDWLANGINSTPLVGNITGLTNSVLAPMVQSTVGDEFLLTTSGEALVGFSVGAAVITVVTGAAGTAAGSAMAGCTYTGAMLGGAISGAGEYLLISGLANGINPAAEDPTLQGTALATVSGAAGGFVGKWLGLIGCFVEGSQVTLSAMPRSESLESSLWEESFAVEDAVATDLIQHTAGISTLASSRTLKVSIEQVPLGSLVPTENPKPWEIDDSLPEPEECSWCQLSLTIERTDGAVVDVELLRPASWVADHELYAGQRLPIQIPELDVSGLATVHAIEACPRLAVGDGSVVTGRFVTRRVEATVELELEDGSTVEGTAIHPVWSLDREHWVALGELKTGELLKSEHGPVAVVAMRVHRRPQAVYNLEVHGQHVYQVGELGLLVHNACCLSATVLCASA